MDSFLSRYKNVLVLVCVLVAQIIGLAAQIRRPNPTARDGKSVRLIRSWAVGLITPPERGLHGTGGWFRGIWDNYLDLRHVREQNQALQTKVGRLQLEQAALLEDARQGQRLQQLLGFRERYIYSTLPAQVIGTAGTDQSRVLYIDKGSRDGLRPDMAVITPDGIVGKLKDVFAHTSQVLEISDQSSGAGVLLESTRLRGVLRGNALGQPQIINLLPDERIKPGEHVVTTGGDQIFPRGLPVGVVDRVVADTQNPPFIDVIIKPAANLGRLEEVLIITQTSTQMPAQAKADLAQSAAAASSQRAADILADRLPGVDPPKTDAGQPQIVSSEGTTPFNQPPPPRHTDYFSPNLTPPASELTPGKAFSVEDVPLPPVEHHAAASEGSKAENPGTRVSLESRKAAVATHSPKPVIRPADGSGGRLSAKPREPARIPEHSAGGVPQAKPRKQPSASVPAKSSEANPSRKPQPQEQPQ